MENSTFSETFPNKEVLLDVITCQALNQTLVARITFKFEDQDIPTKVVENAEEGYSILEITEDHDVHLNHNCGGVCGCSTCHIYVEEGMEFLPEIEDDEEDFVDRAIDPKINSRLACQCEIQPNSGDIVVTIPEQDFNGH